ncbi:MAG: hypothetical protein EBX41_07630 [Chitinophagia bacterium]|nr:hypothetical protein [Chitinophagia bacterium]
MKYIYMLALASAISSACFAQKTETKPPQPETTATEKIDYQQIGTPMPELVLISYDSASIIPPKKKKHRKKDQEVVAEDTTIQMQPIIYTNKDFKNKGNLLVMMFNPTCGHCEDQTEILKKNIDLFKDSRLIMLANKTMKTYIPDFMHNHKIKDFPIITLGMDSTSFINNTFLYRALPQINIYNSERKLIKVYAGEVPMDSLKMFIN